jgi:Sulfotransferase family
VKSAGGTRSPAGNGSASGELTDGLEAALRKRSESVIEVDEPLALISQVQRSGGTLLGRLFDGHPECHAHPHELMIGDVKAHAWPELDLAGDPDEWFEGLQEETLAKLFASGKRVIPLKTTDGKRGTYPFILPPRFQRQIFMEEIARRRPIESEREILNAYMTSLFNAWLDYQNLTGWEKKWVVAFSPRRAWGAGLTKFFELYPDGRLISILRDPLSWYASEQARIADPVTVSRVAGWQKSAQQMRRAAETHRNRVFIVRFDELVLDTWGTMSRLADFLDIDFDPILVTPTFNRYPAGANSSYSVKKTGVVPDPVERYKQVLPPDQQKLIRDECWELYQEVLKLAG